MKTVVLLSVILYTMYNVLVLVGTNNHPVNIHCRWPCCSKCSISFYFLCFYGDTSLNNVNKFVGINCKHQECQGTYWTKYHWMNVCLMRACQLECFWYLQLCILVSIVMITGMCSVMLLVKLATSGQITPDVSPQSHAVVKTNSP